MPSELSIGQLSARSGVSQSALRFYERRGLIAAERSSGNQRRYHPVTLRRVALIQAGKAAGIPLERIRAALDTLPSDRRPTKGSVPTARSRSTTRAPRNPPPPVTSVLKSARPPAPARW